MNKYQKICVIVLDSVGIGQAPDAPEFGDVGVNTLGNISEKVGLQVPNLQKLGLGNINYLKTVLPASKPLANYGKMQEIGDGKDTMTGHWEMMGSTLIKGFQQFVDNGFPQDLIDEFSRLTGRPVLANKAANGMQVIDEFFEEHMQTGGYIVYTSVDSTFQIAAHEEVVPLEELYDACKIARKLTYNDKYNVARVIARPFIGTKTDFKRTANRHDYALKPFEYTVMQKLEDKQLASIAIGKISDIFDAVGVTKSIHTESNQDGIDKTITELKDSQTTGFIFTNLVEFDSVYGHPRDVQGYAKCLEEFDQRLPEILAAVDDETLLIITADHGNDPTYKGNDHTREYVPLLVYANNLEGANYIPLRTTFEDLGETICANFELESTKYGTSFLEELR
ncbi:MAG: phosphopentomutase [Mycoplasmatales bacterium]